MRFPTLLALTLLAPGLSFAASIPAPSAPEQAQGCGRGSPEEQAKGSCKIYFDLEGKFGRNSWSSSEGTTCMQYFTMVYRAANVICNYKKENDAIPGNISSASQVTGNDIDRLRAYSGALEKAKQVHEKYKQLLTDIRGPIFQYEDRYRKILTQHSGSNGNEHSVADNLELTEAYCKGGTYGGIKETSFLVRAVIKAKLDHLNKVKPHVEQVISHDIQWADAGIKGWGTPSQEMQQRLGGLRSVDAGSSDAPAVPEAPHRHEADQSRPLVTAGREGAIAYAGEAGKELTRTAPVIGALVSLSYELLTEGHLSMQGLLAAGVGLANAPAGVALSVFFTFVNNQQNRLAYYRSFATRDAAPKVDQSSVQNIQAPDLSKQFCERIEKDEEEARAKTEERLRSNAEQLRMITEKRQAMFQDQQAIRSARTVEDRTRAYQAFCQKWASEGVSCP